MEDFDWSQFDGLFEQEYESYDEQERKREESIQAFKAQWPKVCMKCGGLGGFEYMFKPAPGPGYLMDFEPCPECSDKGICPRCGTENYEEWVQDEVPCPVCSWNWGENEGDCIQGFQEEAWR